MKLLEIIVKTSINFPTLPYHVTNSFLPEIYGVGVPPTLPFCTMSLFSVFFFNSSLKGKMSNTTVLFYGHFLSHGQSKWRSCHIIICHLCILNHHILSIIFCSNERDRTKGLYSRLCTNLEFWVLKADQRFFLSKIMILQNREIECPISGILSGIAFRSYLLD